MADEKSISLLNSDLTDENEFPSLDYIPMDPVASEPIHTPNLMPDLCSDEELSENRISQLMLEFVSGFTKQYPTSGPSLHMHSLDQALADSLYNQEDACPLMLFLYHSGSTFTNIFCKTVLCRDDITNYIMEKFIVWAWDRTSDSNYQRLLEMLQKHLGDEIKETVALSAINTFPMLICLAFDNGRVNIINLIQGYIPHDLTLHLLKKASDGFDRRIETPHSAEPRWQPVTNEVWSMSPSVLRSIERTNEEFERIANEFVGQTEHIIEIDKIENPSWSSQYLNQKEAIRSHCKENQIEQILVFPCPQVRAQYILQNGFSIDHKVRTYRHGFQFQL